MSKRDLIKAIDLALSKNWEESHQIVQELDDTDAYLIHAILHKIEGDKSNARYWYARAGGKFSDSEPYQELKSLKQKIVID